MQIELPPPPSTNALYTNVPRVGRVKTTAYRKWLSDAALMAGYCEPVPGPVQVCIAAPENSRRDLDNHCKPVVDFLCQKGVIPSDRCKTVRRITMDWHDGDLLLVEVTPA